MIRSFKKWAAVASSVSSLALPAAAIGSALVVPACLFGSPGASNVAQGKQYFSEDPTFDRFFAALYEVQLALGKAPDEEAAARTRIAQALGLPPESDPATVEPALEKRVAALAKAGTSLTTGTSGLDGDRPGVRVIPGGASAGPKDKALVAALVQSGPELAALLGTARQAKPRLDELETHARSLEPSIDVTFRKGGPRKKAEVKKNLEDALRLIPLMRVRASDVEKASRAMIDAIAKATAAGTPPPPPPVEAPPADAPKAGGKKPKSGGGGSAPKPSKSQGSSSSDSPPEPKPEPKKAPPPPPDDFEP